MIDSLKLSKFSKVRQIMERLSKRFDAVLICAMNCWGVAGVVTKTLARQMGASVLISVLMLERYCSKVSATLMADELA